MKSEYCSRHVTSPFLISTNHECLRIDYERKSCVFFLKLMEKGQLVFKEVFPSGERIIVISVIKFISIVAREYYRV